MSQDAHNLRAVLLTVTQGNAKRATKAMLQVLLEETKANVNKIFYEVSQQKFNQVLLKNKPSMSSSW